MNREKDMTNGLRIRGIALAAGLALLLGACSGAAATPTSPASLGSGAAATAAATRVAPPASAEAGSVAVDADPVCALVTKDDVATAVGFSIATASGAGGTCIFQNADPSEYFAVQLFDSQAGMAPYLNVEASAQHVDGLGDDAFWSSISGFLFVRSGTRAILFLNQQWVLTPETDTAHLNSLVTLARAALLHL